jgi:drug/metabolite transporter (DMT)-like permease
MVIFSGTLPATRVAVTGLDPLFVTFARAAVAGCLAGALLLTLRERRPRRSDLGSLIITAAGVVVGFPLLTALALRHITAAHSLVYIGLMPLSTALFGVWRGGERPRFGFWLFSGTGSALVVAFAFAQGGAATVLGDLLMLGAIAFAGLGFAEGAKLSRRLGGWQVISWAVVLSLPITASLMVIRCRGELRQKRESSDSPPRTGTLA